MAGTHVNCWLEAHNRQPPGGSLTIGQRLPSEFAARWIGLPPPSTVPRPGTARRAQAAGGGGPPDGVTTTRRWTGLWQVDGGRRVVAPVHSVGRRARHDRPEGPVGSSGPGLFHFRRPYSAGRTPRPGPIRRRRQGRRRRPAARRPARSEGRASRCPSGEGGAPCGPLPGRPAGRDPGCLGDGTTRVAGSPACRTWPDRVCVAWRCVPRRLSGRVWLRAAWPIGTTRDARSPAWWH
jgi:hypothetical protein